MDADIEKEFMDGVVPKKTTRKKKINSKVKGNAGENSLVKILNERFGEKLFARVPFSGAFLGKSNFHRSATLTEEQQLVFIGDIITPKNFKFTIEHKAYNSAEFWDLFNASSDLNSWIEQSTTDATRANKKPLIIVKYNNKKRIVYTKERIENYQFEYKGWYCLWLEDLLKLEDGFFFD